MTQQAKAIRLHTDLSVGEYVGAMDIDLWSGDQWQTEFNNHQVLVMTAQIFTNILLHGFLALSQVLRQPMIFCSQIFLYFSVC